MGLLRRVGRYGACLFGKGEVRITRHVSGLQRPIARESSSDSELLLAPVYVRDAKSGWWLNRVSQPYARTKNVAGIRRLTATGARPKRGQQRAVPFVAADCQIRQPHFRQCTTQLTHG